MRGNTVRMDSTEGASLSTHILDAAGGGARPGVAVEVRDGSGILVGSGVTDEQGRVGELASGLSAGSYRISWRTGGHFLEDVAVTVKLVDGHHHVPLLATGASAVVYLGV